MGTKLAKLGIMAGALAGVARGTPQRGIVPLFPMGNSTKPNPKPAPTDSTCNAACSVYYPEVSAMTWVPEEQIVYTTKITVATVSVVVITAQNSTVDMYTDTVYDPVPPDYSLYVLSTDVDGRAMVDVPLTHGDDYTYMQVTYPDVYLDYATEYHWEGVVPTHNKRRSALCASATAEPTNAILPEHPDYPQPKSLNASMDDPLGARHKPLWVPVADATAKGFFDGAFPSESAFSYCEPQEAKAPKTAQFLAPLFLTDTTTVYGARGNPGFVHQESTETGWEETPTSTRKSRTGFKTPHEESTEDGWESSTTPIHGPTPQPHPPHQESTGRVNQQTAAGQMSKPDTSGNSNSQGTPPQDIPNAIVSIINNNPQVFSKAASRTLGSQNNQLPPAQPALATPASAFANPTPVMTFVPTVVNGQTRTVPAFILPDSSATATMGQRVTVNGQVTVLAAPPVIFTMLPTTVSGVATSTPAFIISGTSTATVGATVTLNGQPTILVPPLVFSIVPTTINGVRTSVGAYVYPDQSTVVDEPAPTVAPLALTVIPTTINGHATSVTAYIISGSIIATPGETVILNGQKTVLPEPSVVLTSMTTTINGTPTVVPVYLISGSITATPGQTVTLDGHTTVLPAPSPVLTSIMTTINGTPTVVPVYIISGLMTATPGQTVTLDGRTTVLPTSPSKSTESPDTPFTAPASTPADGQSRGPGNGGGSTPGAATPGLGIAWSAVVIALGALIIMWL